MRVLVIGDDQHSQAITTALANLHREESLEVITMANMDEANLDDFDSIIAQDGAIPPALTAQIEHRPLPPVIEAVSYPRKKNKRGKLKQHANTQHRGGSRGKGGKIKYPRR